MECAGANTLASERSWSSLRTEPKNRDGADKHKTAFLTWVAFIGGPRESRQLLGDLVLTQEDNAIGLVVLAIATISLPIVARSNVYCSHLCPHGAVQQLLPRKWKQKKPMPRSLTRLLLWIRPALIAWVVLVSMMQLPFSLVDMVSRWVAWGWDCTCIWSFERVAERGPRSVAYPERGPRSATKPSERENYFLSKYASRISVSSEADSAMAD